MEKEKPIKTFRIKPISMLLQLVLVPILALAINWAYAVALFVVITMIRGFQTIEIYTDTVVIKSTGKKVLRKDEITGLERGNAFRGGTYVLTEGGKHWSVVPCGTFFARPTPAELDELWAAIKS
jgi:hypothetical protein